MTAFEGGIRTPALISGGYLKQLYGEEYSISCDYNNLFYVADFYAMITGLLDIDVSNDNIDGINLWRDIEQECDFEENYNSNTFHTKREEIISFRMGESESDGADTNPEFTRAYVRKNEYKLLVNPNNLELVLRFILVFWIIGLIMMDRFI